MGLFDWLRGKPQPSLDLTFNPPAGSKPFGVDKPISECSDEDIQASREALWKAGADVIKGWRYDAGCDHSSTLFELAVDGMEAATREALPPVPEGQKLRCAALPITATSRAMDARKPTYQRGISLLAETREELEKVRGARIITRKTKKKETKGKCYFMAVKEVRCKRGEEAGTFLKQTNPLTRRVVLGDELAADFERQTRKGGMTPQQWVEQVLRPLVFSGGRA